MEDDTGAGSAPAFTTSTSGPSEPKPAAAPSEPAVSADEQKKTENQPRLVVRPQATVEGKQEVVLEIKQVEEASPVKALVEHYQKTYELAYVYWSQRNALFFALLATMGAAILLTFDIPGGSPLLAVLFELAARSVGNNSLTAESIRTTLTVGIFQTLLLVVILYLLINLFQRDRLLRYYYKYLGLIESDIRTALKFTNHQYGFRREMGLIRLNEGFVGSAIRSMYNVPLTLLVMAFVLKRVSDDFGHGDIGLSITEAILGLVALACIAVYTVPRILPDPEVFAAVQDVDTIPELNARQVLSRANQEIRLWQIIAAVVLALQALSSEALVFLKQLDSIAHTLATADANGLAFVVNYHGFDFFINVTLAAALIYFVLKEKYSAEFCWVVMAQEAVRVAMNAYAAANGHDASLFFLALTVLHIVVLGFGIRALAMRYTGERVATQAQPA